MHKWIFNKDIAIWKAITVKEEICYSKKWNHGKKKITYERQIGKQKKKEREEFYGHCNKTKRYTVFMPQKTDIR